MRFLIAFLAFMPLSVAHSEIVFPTDGAITIQGMCSNFKVYRTVERNLWVGCGTVSPPSGAVEMRAYYVILGIPR